MRERDAFAEIHRAWARLGYPFPVLVPSLATAIGASADRPAALAELLGIVINGGLALPTIRLEELRFGAGTPYDTLARRIPEPPERLLRAEVASIVSEALFDVVEHGTGRRAHGSFHRTDGSPIRVGGKTGTGDNRHKTFDRRGVVIESRVTSRTATFAFTLEDRFFGVLTAFVVGPAAAEYEFTSSLPVQVLRGLAGSLSPLIARSESNEVVRAPPEAESDSRAEAKHARTASVASGAGA